MVYLTESNSRPTDLRRPPPPPKTVGIWNDHAILRISPNPSAKTTLGIRVVAQEYLPLFPYQTCLVVEKCIKGSRARSAGFQPRDVLVQPSTTSTQQQWQPLSPQAYQEEMVQCSSDNQQISFYVARKTKHLQKKRATTNEPQSMQGNNNNNNERHAKKQCNDLANSLDQPLQSKNPPPQRSKIRITNQQVTALKKYAPVNATTKVDTVGGRLEILKVRLQATRPGEPMGLSGGDFPLPAEWKSPAVPEKETHMKIAYVAAGGLAHRAGVLVGDVVVLRTKTHKWTIVKVELFKTTVQKMFEAHQQCAFYVARPMAHAHPMAEAPAPFSPLRRTNDANITAAPVPSPPGESWNQKQAVRLLDYVQTLEGNNRSLWKRYRSILADHIESVAENELPHTQPGVAILQYMVYCEKLHQSNSALASHVAVMERLLASTSHPNGGTEQNLTLTKE